MWESANKAPKNTKLPNEQNSTYSFLAYKTSGFVMRAKPPNTNEKTPPKLYENPPFLDATFYACTAKNSQKHYVLNGFAEKILFGFLEECPKTRQKMDADEIHTIFAHHQSSSKPL